MAPLPVHPKAKADKPKPKPRLNPQALLSKFWSKYHTKAPGKITSIFPRDLYEPLLPNSGTIHRKSRNAAQSYEAARSECRALVRAAVAECERTNAKFTDPDFDIETDFSVEDDNCLFGLFRSWDFDDDEDDDDYDRRKVKTRHVKRSYETQKDGDRTGLGIRYRQRYIGDDANSFANGPRRPGSVHRLSWIFESPQFTVDGYSSSDIKQGSIGDCWWLAAVATIAHRKDLMKKVCVARDEECGVYGFVFHRDGEWISTVVDDNLYLSQPDFGHDMDVYDATGKKARLYKKQKQTGSEALYFAKCEDPNETWLPLLEKAYSKVHGDYDAIHGGWAGAAVEDLTGGVTTVVAGNRVLRKDRLWREMLSSDGEDGEFVFGLSASGDGLEYRRNGLVLSHAYSILKATEVVDEEGKKLRLVKIRNPWGQRSDSGLGEWHGPWSDGSREWTPYMIKKLKHEFGDDGIFWMSYEDVLDHFQWLYRTRLFDKKWTVVQQWTSVKVSWVAGYLKTKFMIEVKEEGMVVIALSQLDERYFYGLEGQYEFSLQFLLKSTGSDTPICAVHPVHTWDRRSITCEVDLEPGIYEIIPKITAERHEFLQPVERVVKTWADKNPQKLRQVGLQYDLAHAKGGITDEDEQLQKKKSEQKRKKRKGKAKAKQLWQMEEVIRDMELAMMQIREEMTRSLHGEGKTAIVATRVSTEVEEGEKKTSEDGGSSEEKVKPPPGFWPEDSLTEKEGTGKNEMASANRSILKEPLAPHPKQLGSKARTIQDENPPNTAEEDILERDVPVIEPRHTKPTPPLPPPLPPPPAFMNDEDSELNTESSFSEPESDLESDTEAKMKKKQPWNAVCVLGLRVYAQHADIKVSLGIPDKKEERSGLITAEGQPVGATS